MHFEPNHIYHVYNRGNNKIKIFFKEDNYIYLLKKIRAEWLLYCDIFCYCLMPNHFHFMLLVNPEGCKNIILGGKETNIQKLSKAIGKTLSSYTQAINIQNKTTGNLFQKKTKAKCLSDFSQMNQNYTTQEYLLNCFHYIHRNPLNSNLVSELKDWPYSSWSDFYGLRNGTLCNKKLVLEKTGLNSFDITSSTSKELDPKVIDLIF